MRRMFVSRSSLEKPRPLERFSRTTSPSRISRRLRRERSSSSSCVEIVVLPAPESPVNQRQKPFSLPSTYSAICSVLLVSVDQDVGDLVPGELLRWALAVAEHLPHLGAGEENVLVVAMRAGLA